MIYRWKQQLEDQQEGKALGEDERDELKRLRKENKNLRMEKEILKKNRLRTDTPHRIETRTPIDYRSIRTMAVCLLVSLSRQKNLV